MVKPGGNFYKKVSPEAGAAYVVTAEQRIQSMGLPGWLVEETFSNLKSNLERRREAGFELDLTLRAEVVGLIHSTLGGNDHMPSLNVELQRFVVGFLQTDEATIDALRSLAETQSE
jgi:hypothetical protein